MINLTINGRQLTAEPAQTVLQVARENLIYIPTLCESEAVAPYGACRMCLVEIKTRAGRERLVASCLYPVEEGLTVITDSERIARIRRTLIELLLSRCPDATEIVEMAKSLGVAKARFPDMIDKKKCILCALCARTCEEVVGVSAISLVDRGVKRQVAPPFRVDFSEACIGCGSCAYVCPTKTITVEEAGDKRTIKWPHSHMDFKLRNCKVCGRPWMPERQVAHIAKISGTKAEEYDTCPACR